MNNKKKTKNIEKVTNRHVLLFKYKKMPYKIKTWVKVFKIDQFSKHFFTPSL